MTLQEVLTIGAVVVASLGGGGLIVLGLSSFLGKVWADRLMESERARHNQELERLRATLSAENEKAVAQMRTELEIYRERHLKAHRDKVEMYRMATDIIAAILANFDRAHRLTQAQAAQALDSFNLDRIRLYGYLAMMVPQEVMDAHDALIDHLILIANGTVPYQWQQVRALGIEFVNTVRKDLAIDAQAIEYRGKL
jgi:FMN phosphatase YigB (HAD superfamily)